MTTRACKDCLADLAGAPPPKAGMRPAPHPGPRCATHHRAETLRRRKRAGELRREQTYGLDPASHAALLAYQGGTCAICQKSTGARRALAVDHDHALAREHDHDDDKGCFLCVRGLLCKRCNRILGELRDDAGAFLRASSYLAHPPWRRVWSALSASAPSASHSDAATSSAAGVTASAGSRPRT